MYEKFLENQLTFNKLQLERNTLCDETIKALSNALIEVMDEVEKQNEAIRKLQEIVYKNKDSFFLFFVIFTSSYIRRW